MLVEAALEAKSAAKLDDLFQAFVNLLFNVAYIAELRSVSDDA